MKKDKYKNYEKLTKSEKKGVDFDVKTCPGSTKVAIIAIHGGNIEPGTTEIAKIIADRELSFYTFIGTKSPGGNGDLHITSSNFDEPECLKLVQSCNTVISIHGENNNGKGNFVMVGGLNTELAARIEKNLKESGFKVIEPSEDVRGLDERNICNRGMSGTGVQLEISMELRNELRICKGLMTRFATAVREVLEV